MVRPGLSQRGTPCSDLGVMIPNLELQAKRHLPGAISGILRCLWRAQDSEG